MIEIGNKMCTYRPSLSSQEEISRNKVDVLESVSRKNDMELDQLSNSFTLSKYLCNSNRVKRKT